MKKLTDMFRKTSEVGKIQGPMEDEKETQEKVTSNNSDSIIERAEQ